MNQIFGSEAPSEWYFMKYIAKDADEECYGLLEPSPKFETESEESVIPGEFTLVSCLSCQHTYGWVGQLPRVFGFFDNLGTMGRLPGFPVGFNHQDRCVLKQVKKIHPNGTHLEQ